MAIIVSPGPNLLHALKIPTSRKIRETWGTHCLDHCAGV
jgi:hypothetical protein